jgi:hypothetical protein
MAMLQPVSPHIRLWLFVAASGAAHSSLAWLETRSAQQGARAATRVESVNIEVQIEQGLTVQRASEPQPEPPPKPRTKPARERAAHAPEASSAPSPPIPSLPATPEATPTPSEPAPHRPLDLSPLTAASSVFDVRADPSAQRGPASPHLLVAPQRNAAAEAYFRQLEAARPYISQNDDPKLEHRGDHYEFVGNGFDATIEPDGSVRFDDKYGNTQFALGPMHMLDGTAAISILTGTFDIYAWLDAMHGNDPYRSERRWFLERTVGLRDRLAQKAFRQLMARARLELSHALQDVWNDAKLSLAEQKQRTFEYWDVSAEDDIGRRGRRLVEAFVRDRCPQSSACAFSPDELVRFNALRKSHVRFAPYDAVQDGPEEPSAEP